MTSFRQHFSTLYRYWIKLPVSYFSNNTISFKSISFQIGLNAVGTIIVVGVVNYRLMLPVIFVAIMSYTLRIICLPASRAVKRLEATSKHSL